MTVNPSQPSDRMERQRALLAKLEGRLFRASELRPAAAGPLDPPAKVIQSTRVSNASGSFSFAESRIDLDGVASPHGIRFPVSASASPICMKAVSLLGQDATLAEIPVESLAFIDCETTGLSGGTGTVAFLVGVGYFAGQQFVVEQYFMEDYDEEAPMIEHLGKRLADFQGFVSYNGKAYDLPLLRTRFIFHRCIPRIDKPHFDLLHPSRRFWRGRLPDCSLHSVEQGVLNLRRMSDVDGYLIPQIYFDYVRGKRREQMVRVFDHHAQDIVSLAALAGRMSCMVDSPLDETVVEAEDQIRLARMFMQCQQPERAIGCLQGAICRLRDPLMIYAASMRLARHYKQCGQWGEACAIWEAQIESGPGGRLEPYVELAKYYEHQARDVMKAHAIAERAYRAVSANDELRRYLGKHLKADVPLDELLHRLRRLRGRMLRHEGGA